MKTNQISCPYIDDIATCDQRSCHNVAPIIKSVRVEGNSVFINGTYYGRKVFMNDKMLRFVTPLNKEQTINFVSTNV